MQNNHYIINLIVPIVEREIYVRDEPEIPLKSSITKLFVMSYVGQKLSKILKPMHYLWNKICTETST